VLPAAGDRDQVVGPAAQFRRRLPRTVP
jgi:hypothetical protein